MAGNAYAEYEGAAANSEAWAKAEDEYGVTIMDWSEEDVLEWKKTVASFLPEYAKDEASTEAVQVLKDYIKEWKPELAKQLFSE
jgi:hydrogenase maturation factor HypF (carbamoyltransferase family)